ncbi:MAG: hypothetical protein HY306_09375 [Nitrosomonadales bacterium]|nr:hypothetical protein [Nitrosomonadales bacterium]
MISAIGSHAYSAAIGAGSGTVGLEAQLARYQKQLSDCVNCDSARTLEGKTRIEAISSKISELKARIEETDKVQTAGDRPATAVTQAQGWTGTVAASSNPSTGNFLNVFA